MRKLVLSFIALLAFSSSAQPVVQMQPGTRGAFSVITEDTDDAIFCRYIGTSPCASIAVAAGGDITFTNGTCGAESASTTLECPLSAPYGGVFTVANAACNTIGEVLDIVNASSDWRCLPWAALRTDSSNDTLVTISATQATGANGLGLKFDTSVLLSTTAVLAPTGSAGYKTLGVGNGTGFQTRFPWTDTSSVLQHVYGLSTYAAGTSLMTVYSVDRKFGASGSETVTTVSPALAMGATTVGIDFGSCATPATACNPAWGPAGLWGLDGQQLLVRVTNSSAMSANTLAISGLTGPKVTPFGPPGGR